MKIVKIIAIDGISIKIKQMKQSALVGPSGSGKSTFANLISRFYDVDSGEILIGNVKVKDIEKNELMNTISFVFQNSKLLKTSIYENVKMAKPEATKVEVLHALNLAQCDDIIKKLPNGIDTVIGTKEYIYLEEKNKE